MKSLRTLHDKHAGKHLSLRLSTPEVKHAIKCLGKKDLREDVTTNMLGSNPHFDCALLKCEAREKDTCGKPKRDLRDKHSVKHLSR